MGREIERKFLVPKLPTAARGSASDEIRQGYLAVAADGTEIRVRQQGKRHVLTVKRGRGASRAETEVPLAAESFARLWPLTAGRRLAKRRYRIEHGPWTIELDVYRGKLKGLMVAEVEFSSAAAARSFRPPPWFGREVTGVNRFSNAALACRSKPPGRRG